MFKTGLVSISFRNHSVEDIIQRVSETNLEYIEWGSDVHAPFNNPDAIDIINKLSEKYGIKTSSYGTYFKVGRDDPNDFVGYLNASKLLGTNTLRIWMGTKASEDYSSKEREEIYRDCDKLSRMAEKFGSVICCECHPKTLTDSIDSTIELMKNVNRNVFKMYWQPNQFKDEAYNCLSAKMIAPYTVNIHVFNWKDKDKFELETGAKLWKKYLECFDGTQKLLLEFMPDDRIESLPKEADALRKILEDFN